MKLRVIATLVAVLALGVGSASAQTIGVFADLGGASCNVAGGAIAPFYILAISGGAVTSIGGAEFRVAGLSGTPGIDYLVVETPNPAATVALGSPMGLGCNIGFPGAQASPGWLYTITFIPINPIANVDKDLVVQQHTNPSNPNFPCPLITLFDPPAYTKICVDGGTAFLASSRDCTVAVEKTSWSQVKGLYN